MAKKKEEKIAKPVSTSVRHMLLQSLNELGGVDYLKKLAMIEPKAYAALVGKLIPQVTELTGGDGGPINIYFPPL